MVFPLGLNLWITERKQKPGRSRYLVETSRGIRVLVPLWLLSLVLFWGLSVALAELMFETESPPWTFTLGFGLGFGMTAMAPVYELWLRRRQPKIRSRMTKQELAELDGADDVEP
jgi:hypothetical protein